VGAADGCRRKKADRLFCDTRHSGPTNKMIFCLKLEGVQIIRGGPMASFNNRAGVSENAQDSRPVAFSIGVKSAVLLIASSMLSLISRVTGKLRTWRQRDRERAELARMSQAELHDIGVSSADRWEEISKPFWRK
jgi:uncharacterized protein YjiS (DUF1127 family)